MSGREKGWLVLAPGEDQYDWHASVEVELKEVERAEATHRLAGRDPETVPLSAALAAPALAEEVERLRGEMQSAAFEQADAIDSAIQQVSALRAENAELAAALEGLVRCMPDPFFDEEAEAVESARAVLARRAEREGVNP